MILNLKIRLDPILVDLSPLVASYSLIQHAQVRSYQVRPVGALSIKPLDQSVFETPSFSDFQGSNCSIGENRSLSLRQNEKVPSIEVGRYYGSFDSPCRSVGSNPT